MIKNKGFENGGSFTITEDEFPLISLSINHPGCAWKIVPNEMFPPKDKINISIMDAELIEKIIESIGISLHK